MRSRKPSFHTAAATITPTVTPAAPVHAGPPIASTTSSFTPDQI